MKANLVIQAAQKTVSRVYLRERKAGRGRVTFYLDLYTGQGIPRRYERIEGLSAPTKHVNTAEYKRVWAVADKMRAEREELLAKEQRGELTRLDMSFTQFMIDGAARKSATSQTFARRAADLITALAGCTVTFRMLTPDFVRAVREAFAKKFHPSTAAAYYGGFRIAVRQAHRDGIIDRNPCERVNSIRPRYAQKVFLTSAELRALNLAPCADGEVKRAFLFQCFTGLRFGDLFRLTAAHIEGGVLRIEQQKTKSMVAVPLHAEALKLLEGAETVGEKLFDLHGGVNAFNAELAGWAKAAGISKKLTSHVARHTFATIALTAGVDLYSVSKLLGHSSVSQTQVYAKLVDEKKREAIALLPSIS